MLNLHMFVNLFMLSRTRYNKLVSTLKAGGKDVHFERKNWRPHCGFGDNGLETDGIRDASVRVSSFLYT